MSALIDIRTIKHCGYLVRSLMNELLQIFESIVMFNRLDGAWSALEQNASDASLNMDGLISSQSQFGKHAAFMRSNHC